MSKTFKRRKRIWDDEADSEPRNTKRRGRENKIRRPKTRTYKFLEQYKIDDNDESVYNR